MKIALKTAVALAVVGATLGWAESASADVILTVPNAQFNNPFITPGNWSATTPSDWTLTSGVVGISNQFDGAATYPESPTVLPQGKKQAVQFHGAGSIRSSDLLNPDTTVHLAAEGNIYTVSVWANHGNGGFRLLFDGSQVTGGTRDFVVGDALNPGKGGLLKQVAFTYTAVAADAGKAVSVQLFSGNNNSMFDFPEVSFVALSVPEPASLGLLSLGGLLLLPRRRQA